MGKTFRRGGSERGSYYPGKSIRDKRQNNGGTYRVPKGDIEFDDGSEIDYGLDYTLSQ